MKIKLFCKRVIALALIVGALPFVNNASAYAKGESGVRSQESRLKYLDDYSQPIGFTYGAQAKVQAAYLWRGLYCGGLNTQMSANVGYGGLYFDMWWNIGVTDWTFRTFEPEVDLTLGFARWGLDVYLLYIHNFNCGFFDFGNYPDKGNRLELDVRYTVSSKLPLSFLWATRICAADGYVVGNDTVFAWSSYAEISYTQKLRDGFSIYGAIGVTPWRSVYTLYQRDFALQNIEVRLRKDWTVAERCGLMLQGQLCVNPSAVMHSILTNITLGVYLR